jgi:hypothetical protein
VLSWEPKEDCVVDYKYSFHMCLRKEYFENLELVESGVVHLGDGKTIKVQG